MNRKKRKLNYIRLKNAVRAGKTFVVRIKVSAELDTESLADIIHDEAIYWSKYWSKKYKTPLTFMSNFKAMIDDDFAYNLFTVDLHYRSTAVAHRKVNETLSQN
jgi:hypothetical protein